jgi:hypothetical protein
MLNLLCCEGSSAGLQCPQAYGELSLEPERHLAGRRFGQAKRSRVAVAQGRQRVVCDPAGLIRDAALISDQQWSANAVVPHGARVERHIAATGFLDSPVPRDQCSAPAGGQSQATFSIGRSTASTTCTQSRSSWLVSTSPKAHSALTRSGKIVAAPPRHVGAYVRQLLEMLTSSRP